MRIFALELNNDIKGIEQRQTYIEGLIAQLPAPDLVVLPELALCSYMASQKIWQYADESGRYTSAWAVQVARRYNTFIGAGYLDKQGGDYYNRYLIAGPDDVCGIVSKSEGEAAPATSRTSLSVTEVSVCQLNPRLSDPLANVTITAVGEGVIA